MKLLGTNRIVLVITPLMLTAISCKSTTPPPAPETSSSVAVAEGVPGGVIVNTITYTAKITNIDSKTRKITLMGSDGDEFTVKAGPEVTKFDQLRSGDLVRATVTEELAVQVLEGGRVPRDTAAAAVLLSPKGGKPGAIAAGTVTIVGEVTAIDEQAHTATLRFSDGTIRTFNVRKDVALSDRRIGSKVVIQVTEMVAISVERS